MNFVENGKKLQCRAPPPYVILIIVSDRNINVMMPCACGNDWQSEILSHSLTDLAD